LKKRAARLRSKRKSWWKKRCRQALDRLLEEDDEETELENVYLPPSKRRKAGKDDSSSSDESNVDDSDPALVADGVTDCDTSLQPLPNLGSPRGPQENVAPMGNTFGGNEEANNTSFEPSSNPHQDEDVDNSFGGIEEANDTSLEPSANPIFEEDEEQAATDNEVFLQNINETQNVDEALAQQDETEVAPMEDLQGDQLKEADFDQALGKVAQKAEEVRPIREFLAGLKAAHQVSHGTILKVYQFIKTNAQALAEADRKGLLPSMSTLRRQLKKNLPQTLVTYTYLDNGVEKTVFGAATLPRWLALDRLKLLRVRASIDLKELFKFYSELHPPWEGQDLVNQTIELSADGVTESNSGQHRFYIISLAFSRCKAPLPWHVWEFRSQTGPTLNELFAELVNEINNAGVQVSLIVVDGKEQNYIRGMVTTNGYYGCARCLTCGTTKKLNKVHYPFNQLNPQPKTHEMFVDLFENKPELFVVPNAHTRHLRFGLEQRSPLLDLQNFDIVQDIPLDPMHLLHLGITKKTWDRMFETEVVWKSSVRNKVRDRFNRCLQEVKVPSEITRKMYGVTPSKMKASQWQTVDMFCLATLALQLTGNKELTQVLLLYTFIVRLGYGGNYDFEQVKQRLNLTQTMNTFYKLYSKVFGVGAFTFNLHSFYHFLESRERNGPVWTHSTGKYESLYAVTRRCYDGRTFNTPLQLLENFHGAARTEHRCNLKRSLNMADKTTAKTDDTLIYTRDGLYQIDKILEDGALKVRKLIVTPLDTSDIIKLPWAFVGVFKLHNIETYPTYLDKEDVVAKAILCKDIISTCYTEWLLT
jgi:hypothetical protein